MNKTELETELEETKKLLVKEKETANFLLSQQNKYKEMAEVAGSKEAVYKAMVTRLRDEFEKLDSALEHFKR